MTTVQATVCSGSQGSISHGSLTSAKIVWLMERLSDLLGDVGVDAGAVRF